MVHQAKPLALKTLLHARSPSSSVDNPVCFRTLSVRHKSVLRVKRVLCLVRQLLVLLSTLEPSIERFAGWPLLTRETRMISILVVSPSVTHGVSRLHSATPSPSKFHLYLPRLLFFCVCALSRWCKQAARSWKQFLGRKGKCHKNTEPWRKFPQACRGKASLQRQTILILSYLQYKRAVALLLQKSNSFLLDVKTRNALLPWRLYH